MQTIYILSINSTVTVQSTDKRYIYTLCAWYNENTCSQAIVSVLN